MNSSHKLRCPPRPSAQKCTTACMDLTAERSKCRSIIWKSLKNIQKSPPVYLSVYIYIYIYFNTYIYIYLDTPLKNLRMDSKHDGFGKGISFQICTYWINLSWVSSLFSLQTYLLKQPLHDNCQILGKAITTKSSVRLAFPDMTSPKKDLCSMASSFQITLMKTNMSL